MPRKPRNIHVGGIYHIVQRGVERRKIFLKNQDYSRFTIGLELFNSDASVELWHLITHRARGGAVSPQQLGERLNIYRMEERNDQELLIELLAFALMPNHFHLIVREITPGGVSAFMQKMGGYSSYFNQQYHRTGSLFQSRYQSIEITTEEQLLIAFVYVHTNSVELWEPGWKQFKVRDAKEALRRLKEYRWSSFRDYIGEPTFPHTTQRDFFLEFLGGANGCWKAVEDWVKFKAEKTSRVPEMLE